MPASVVVGRRPEPRRPRPVAGRRARDGNWLMHGTTVWFLRNARERRRPDSSWSANPTAPFDINCGGGTARRGPAGRFTTSASGRRHRTRNDLVMRACATCGLLTELTAGDERNMSCQVNWGRCKQEVGPIELALNVVGRSKHTEFNGSGSQGYHAWPPFVLLTPIRAWAESQGSSSRRQRRNDGDISCHGRRP
jgi:hypothetical protein